MAIPTRAQWTKLRDGAGAKAGLVKGVSIGSLLDAYHKAGAGKKGLNQKFAQVKSLSLLDKGVKAYRKSVPASNAKLVKVLKDLQDSIDDEVKMNAMAANPTHKASQYLMLLWSQAKVVKQTGDPKQYDQIWKDTLPKLQEGLAALGKIDPTVKPHQQSVAAFMHPSFSVSGQKVVGSATDPAEVKARVQNAASMLSKLAKAVLSELVYLGHVA